jgi:hypothetical protein
MTYLRKVGLVGCLLLGVSALAVASVAKAGASDPETVETTTPSPAPSPQDRPGIGRDQALSGNPQWGIPIKMLSATRDRPIFSPSRRPPPPAVVDQPIVAAVPTVKQREPERPQLSLLGTIVGGDDGFGIFMDQTTKTPLRIRIGAEYQGWTLRLLQPGSVTLVKGRETAVLAFPEPASNQAPAVARPIAAPPAIKPRRQIPAFSPSPQSTSLRAQARNLGDAAPLQ